MVELSEKMLLEAGGWQAVKHARALVDMGRVSGASYAPPLLKGMVREGDTEFRAGLKIVTKTNIENICTCRQSREWGTICAHSLAVGLAVAGRKPAGAAAVPPKGPASFEKTGPKTRFVAGSTPEARLFFVLPPALEPAWERKNLMLGVEAEILGKRILLQALKPAKTVALSAEDVRAVEAIVEAIGMEPGGMMILNPTQFLRCLEGLRGHSRVTLGKSKPIVVKPELIKPRLTIKIGPDGALSAACALQGLVLTAPGAAPWVWRDNTLTALTPGLPDPYHVLYREKLSLDPNAGGAFLSGELENLRQFFEIVMEGSAGGAPTEFKTKPGTPRVALSLEGSLNHLAGQLQCIYGKRIITIGITPAGERFVYPENGESFSRNLDFERDALKRFTRWGFDGPDTTGHYALRGQQHILPFFAAGLPELQKEWEVEIGSRFEHVSGQIERVKPEIEIRSSGEDWLELGFSMSAPDGERFASADIRRLLQSGQSHTKLKNGKIAVFDAGLLEEFEEVLRDCDPTQMRPGQYRVKKIHAGFLSETFAENPDIRVQGDNSWKKSAKLGSAQEITEIPLGELEAVLRPYQKQGVYWMDFLAQNGLAGILADEMGLGKTLQTLTFLRLRKGSAPSLVICPTTLVENWRRECLRFTPDIKVLVIDGANRERKFAEIEKTDLVITSYALLRRDIEQYRSVVFEVIVLDEAQHIKNPDTQNAQSAGALRSNSRMVLTGTPMENSVRDLWSIFQFLMPGYLGRRDDFKERYEAPLTREGDAAEVRSRLRRRLKPFLLRRTKKEVAPELPDKIEQVVLCDLTASQRSLYEELLKASREKIDDAMNQKNLGQGRMLMLTALLRLRQACCDLRLLDTETKAADFSGKVDALGELLDEAIDGGHRILLFSQFVQMLSLLRGMLEARELRYSYLDGSTKNRMQVVDEFQNTPEIPIFLISLKAGGVGLNLTAADTVIHFDPWWNPAVEAQATDRAHRIGQKNVVTSYKLIARETVEEKILKLQNKKRDAISAVVESEAAFESALTFEEIRELLN